MVIDECQKLDRRKPPVEPLLGAYVDKAEPTLRDVPQEGLFRDGKPRGGLVCRQQAINVIQRHTHYATPVFRLHLTEDTY